MGGRVMLWQRQSLPWTMGFTAVLIASIAAPALAATCAQVDKLALQLPRPVQAEYAGFVVPAMEADGAPSFADECLQIKVQGGGTGYDPLQELQEGKADLAIAEGSYVAQKIASGESLTVIAGYYQRNGLVWIGMNKARFANLAELVSKKVGVWCCGYDLPFLATMSKMKQAVPSRTPQDPISMHQLHLGELDLASAMVYDELASPLQVLDSSTNFLTQQSDIFVLNPADHGITLVHNVLVVKTSTLSTNREKIVRFLKVVTKTWQFCRINEVACASAFSEYGVPTPYNLWQMREVNKFIFPALSGYGLGVLSLERWAAMNEWLVAYGALAAPVSDSVVDNTLALDAGALEDVSQWSPFSAGSLHFCAEYGSVGSRICKEKEHILCKAGHEPDGTADYTCKKCEPGRFAPNERRMNTCMVCPVGRYSKTYGQSECTFCAPGRFWAPTESTITNASVTSCTACPVGLFAASGGASACRACGEGSATSKEATVDCERCPFGRYAGTKGLPECLMCKEDMATDIVGAVAESQCLCPEGTYESLPNQNCLRCPEGMLCNANSLEKTLRAIAADPTLENKSVGEFPQLRKGYHSKRSDPFKVYLCREDRTCPGGVPEKCSGNVEGIACGKCKRGYYQDGHQCLQCAGIDEEAFNYPLMQIVCGPVVVLILYFLMRNQRDDWGAWWNEIFNSLYTLVVQYQILGLLMFTMLQYPDVLASVMTPWTYLVDVASMLRLSCSQYRDLSDLMIVKGTLPALMLAIFALTYAISWVVGKCATSMNTLESATEQTTTPEAASPTSKIFPLDVNVFINIYFAIFHAFYMAICLIPLQLFMCYEHPTGDWSLLFAPDVFCYSSEDWQGMLTELVFTLLAYIPGPIAGFAYVVIVAPVNFHKTCFHNRWKFLFIKFKLESFWWSIFHMLRTLMLVLTLVFSQMGSRQVYYIFIILLFYAFMLVIWSPWRHRSSNLLDLFVTCSLLFFCALSSSFSRRYGWLDDQISELAATVTFSPIVVFVFLVGWVSWSKIGAASQNAKKAKQMELAADSRTVFAKYISLHKDKAQAFVEGLSAQDHDVLRCACSLIVADLLGYQPGHTGLPWRLVHQEQKSGAKTWHSRA